MKIIVCGHGRHGKDTVSQMLGGKFSSSSLYALEKVIWPVMRNSYSCMDNCYRDRENHREKWFNLISEYNKHDPARLAREILRNNDIYCGLRSKKELQHCKKQGLFDLSIWVDASERIKPEDSSSCTIEPVDCDVIIQNNGSLLDLYRKVMAIKHTINWKKIDVKNEIITWANNVFPDRTITNAIQKLVLEEIPEYLMNQYDPMELADLGILLYDIAFLAGVDLEEAMIRKMEVNKNRTWEINEETGLLNHIGDDE